MCWEGSARASIHLTNDHQLPPASLLSACPFLESLAMVLGAGPSEKSGSEGGETTSFPHDIWGFLVKSSPCWSGLDDTSVPMGRMTVSKAFP